VVVEEVVNTNVNASKEEHIGTTAEEGATPVNTEEQEQAAIEANESTSSIKTGEGKTAHDAQIVSCRRSTNLYRIMSCIGKLSLVY